MPPRSKTDKREGVGGHSASGSSVTQAAFLVPLKSVSVGGHPLSWNGPWGRDVPPPSRQTQHSALSRGSQLLPEIFRFEAKQKSDSLFPVLTGNSSPLFFCHLKKRKRKRKNQEDNLFLKSEVEGTNAGCEVNTRIEMFRKYET